MPRYLNPPTLPRPLSRYSQAIVLGQPYKRLVISGQIGARLDGTMGAGIDEQMDIALGNVVNAVLAADLAVADIVKLTCFATVPGSVDLFRRVRDGKLGMAAPASTYVEVAGLARPDCLVEIEGEALREAPLRG